MKVLKKAKDYIKSQNRDVDENMRDWWVHTQCFPFEAIDRSRHANRSPREVRRDRLIVRHVS